MYLRHTKLLILFNLLCLFGIAQQVSFIKYSVYDGMVANPVRCIYQDTKGFIWIGTFDGLSRYDGYKFSNYTNTNGLSHNFVNSIFEINDKLLIAENNGAVDVIQNNSFLKRFNGASAFNLIMPFQNRLLLTTDMNGFYEYKNDSLFSVAQQKTTTSLGHFIAVNDSLMLCDGVDDNLFLFKKDLTVALSLKHLGFHFYDLFQDSKKRIWACTTSGLKLLQVLPGDHPSVSFVSLPTDFDLPVLSNTQVTSMIEEANGSFWIGTVKGLVRIFPGGSSYVYNEKDGLPSAIVYTLYLDKEKNIWIGTSLGLAKWVSKNNVVFYNTDNKDYKGDVLSIALSDNNTAVIRTDHGLQLFNFNTKEFKNIKATSNSYTPIQGTSPILAHYDNKIVGFDSTKTVIVSSKEIDSTIKGVIFANQNSDGTIFLGTFDGLFAVKEKSVKKILPYRITALSISNEGHVLAGTWGRGVFRVHALDNTRQSYVVQDLTPFIKQSQIRSIFSDSKKNIWVGTRHEGAFCLKEKTNGIFDVQHFNRQSGLMSDWITTFAETKTGDIWIGSYLGLDKLVKQQSGYRAFNFSKVVNFFAEIKSITPIGNDNWLCVANTGIATFKDENLNKAVPFKAIIFSTNFGVLENKLTLELPKEKIFLHPNQNTARFEFGALGFINERQILYSYRLKGGNDTTWSKPENIHEASYASLSPGEYTFEVKTMGWNGEYSIPAAFSFHISTPFWKQWWFITLCLVIVMIFFYSLYRYRIRQLLRLQNVRNSIATDLHDDIGSSLTNISILSELSSKNLSQPVKAQEFLQRISEEVQTSSQAMDDIIWSVNSRNDSLQETMARMRRYAAELFDDSETSCHLQLDENNSNKKLSMEQRRDVYLIYKEALNNIYKHAQAKNVWIGVAQNQNHLLMQIKDDGRGFNIDHVTHRNGLKNLRSRTEKWNGRIIILSGENKGTKIEIKIPLED